MQNLSTCAIVIYSTSSESIADGLGSVRDMLSWLKLEVALAFGIKPPLKPKPSILDETRGLGAPLCMKRGVDWGMSLRRGISDGIGIRSPRLAIGLAPAAS